MTRSHDAYDDEVLRELIAGYLRDIGAPLTIVRLDRRLSPYGSTARLEEVDVALEDGRELALMLKDLRPASVLPVAREVRPAALINPAREPRVYSRLLGPQHMGAPAVAAVADDRTGRFLVLLERLEALQLCHVGDVSTWLAAARWLARLHVLCRDAAAGALARGEVPLLVYDDEWYERWLNAAAARIAETEIDAERRQAFERLARGYHRLVSALSGGTPTLLHGECYASNVLVPSSWLRGAVCPVDWEMAALGPAAFDIAALTSGDWPDAVRRRVMAAYLDEAARLGGAVPPLHEFSALVDCGRIHLAVQLLAWDREWTPPRAQARDWLGEALALAALSPVVA